MEEYIVLISFLCSLDDTLEVNLEEDSSEESSFLEAVKQMKGKEYENILDLCTQQIEKGTTACPFNLYMMFGPKKKNNSRRDCYSFITLILYCDNHVNVNVVTCKEYKLM